jgi:tripartite-type tricarboxylate transporter receptor subunit TctC
MLQRKKEITMKFVCVVVSVFWGLFLIFVNKTWSGEVYPARPITLIALFPPGGVADVTARAIASAASEYLGTSVIVLNKPGAGGTIGLDYLKNSKPDGYTLANAGIPQVSQAVYTFAVNWGPKDFAAIIGYANLNAAYVVRSDAPWKSFDEWVQYVKKNPGFKVGDYGPLSSSHIITEWLAKKYNLKVVSVHFQGDAPGIMTLLGGHIDLYGAFGSHAPHVKAGKLRTLLQVSGEPLDTDPKSVTRLMDLPGTSVFSVLVDVPFAIWAPKGIPDPIQLKLNEAFKKAIEKPEFVRTLQSLHMSVQYYDAKRVSEMAIKNQEEFGALIKELGLQIK